MSTDFTVGTNKIAENCDIMLQVCYNIQWICLSLEEEV